MEPLTPPTARPEITAAISRGAARLLTDMGYAVTAEVTLGSGRRVDLMGLDASGKIIVVEVKSGEEDFRADGKWETYLDYCDRFYFAVDPDFPQSLLPDGPGLILADRFGAAILREGPDLPLNAARRKAVTLAFARTAAGRLMNLIDPREMR